MWRFGRHKLEAPHLALFYVDGAPSNRAERGTTRAGHNQKAAGNHYAGAESVVPYLSLASK